MPQVRVQEKVKSETGDSWCTPERIRDAVWRFGGQPALDPFTNPNSIINAKVEWYGPHVGGTDGLVMPWHVCGGLVFFNPPHSRKRDCMAKAHAEAKAGAEIIGLLPADTDTRWFHDYATAADRRCFIRRRLTFGGDVAHPARFASLLIYWGKRAARFERDFAREGWVV